MSKKIMYLFIISAMFLSSATFIMAEDNETSSKDDVKNVSSESTGAVPTLYKTSENDTDKENNNEETTENKIKIFRAEREQIKEKVQSIREEAKQKMEDFKEKVKELKDKKKAKLQEERILGREQALERFDKTIEKIETSKDKVATQVSKMEVKGIIIPASVKDLSILAEAKIADAKVKIAEISTVLSSSTNILTKENKTKITTLTTETQALLKEAQKALNDEVLMLRQALKNKMESSTTNTN